jgi:hypothetical protein
LLDGDSATSPAQSVTDGGGAGDTQSENSLTANSRNENDNIDDGTASQNASAPDTSVVSQDSQIEPTDGERLAVSVDFNDMSEYFKHPLEVARPSGVISWDIAFSESGLDFYKWGNSDYYLGYSGQTAVALKIPVHIFFGYHEGVITLSDLRATFGEDWETADDGSYHFTYNGYTLIFSNDTDDGNTTVVTTVLVRK